MLLGDATCLGPMLQRKVVLCPCHCSFSRSRSLPLRLCLVHFHLVQQYLQRHVYFGQSYCMFGQVPAHTNDRV